MTTTNWIDYINIISTIVTVALTIAMFRLNKTMKNISQSEHNSKQGHDLSITLPMMYGKPNSFEGMHLRDFVIINNKNKTENIYRLFLKKDGKELPFWFATQAPLIIPPYDSKLITSNTKKPSITSISEYQFFAVTNDATTELSKHIDCYDKPIEENNKIS